MNVALVDNDLGQILFETEMDITPVKGFKVTLRDKEYIISDVEYMFDVKIGEGIFSGRDNVVAIYLDPILKENKDS